MNCSSYMHFLSRFQVSIPSPRFFLVVILIIGSLPSVAQELYSCRDGYVYWVSDAPLELIEAESDNLQGIIRADDQTFAFSMSIRSFDGFNSGLQKEHFHENYMETEEFGKATFSGKILEQVNFSTPGTRNVRAKGVLEIHGVSQERIISATIVVKPGGVLEISSDFTALLVDHEISIPRIVFQKIAEEINVRIRATLTSNAP